MATFEIVTNGEQFESKTILSEILMAKGTVTGTIRNLNHKDKTFSFEMIDLTVTVPYLEKPTFKNGDVVTIDAEGVAVISVEAAPVAKRRGTGAGCMPGMEHMFDNV